MSFFSQHLANQCKNFCKQIKIVSSVRKFSDAKSEIESNVLKSSCKPLEIDPIPLTNFIYDQNVSNFPNKIAMVEAISGQSWTYARAYEQSRAFGSALQKEGLRKGDVLAIMMPNCPEYLIALLGANGLGCIVTTINPTYTPFEVAHQLRTSKTKIILTHPAILSTVEEAINISKNSVKIIIKDSEPSTGSIISGHFSYSKMINDTGSQYLDQIPGFNFQDDIATLLYSSGTTGLPKGVMLTHANTISNISQMYHVKEPDLMCYYPTTDSYQPVSICILPMFHVGGLNAIALLTLRSGGKLITLPSFDPKTFTAALEEHKPTTLQLVPPLASFCALSPMVKTSHLENLLDVKVAAAPIGETLINQFAKKAPNVPFRECWGMTELSPMATMSRLKSVVKKSCGILLPNTEAKIVDIETGQALGPGQVGEICIRGPQVMKGYLDNQEATEATITPDGWLHSGDLALYDEDQNFFIVDRLKELIKVKGFQVPPAELEDLIRSIPGVIDTAVIGIPHQTSGEVPRAYIVKSPNQPLSENDVNDFINSRVAKYKRIVGGIEFVSAIPKSAAGKILRKDIRAQYNERNTN